MRSVKEYIDLFEKNINSFVPAADHEQSDMREMMLYSLEGGGKRVRPVLCMAFCELCGGRAENALRFAAAVEFIHTYSLIHDDLPCMDNDAIRRGKAASHIRFGEANALLAGDALLTHAFDLIARAAEDGQVSASAVVQAVAVLSRCAGMNGMIGGQYIDLATEGIKVPVDSLYLMDLYKTAALIKAASQLGCIAAGADEEKIKNAGEFADKLGLAFQIIDDLLDYEDENASDKVNEKATYPELLGVQEARNLADKYTEQAINSLALFGEHAEVISAFADRLLHRTN